MTAGNTEEKPRLTKAISEHALASARRLKKTVTEHAEYVQDQMQPAAKPASQDIVRAVTADLAAAGVTSFAISPVVAICDMAVVHAAAKRMTMAASIRQSLSTLAFRPWAFIGTRGFAVVWGIYTATCAYRLPCLRMHRILAR